MKRVLNPGKVTAWNGAGNEILVPLFVSVEFGPREGEEFGRLRITGVEGPKSNGDCYGSCGQCTDSLLKLKSYAPGWDEALAKKLHDVWERWHLNDMRAECEHQRAAGWVEQAREKVTLYHWRLNREAQKLVRDAIRESERRLKAGETVKLTEDILDLSQKADSIITTSSTPPGPLYTLNGPQYTGDAYNRPTEEKTRGWVRFEEHAEGLLGKPCEVCGYKYGHAWKKEEVPAEVIAFLEGLPESAAVPAWV